MATIADLVSDIDASLSFVVDFAASYRDEQRVAPLESRAFIRPVASENILRGSNQTAEAATVDITIVQRAASNSLSAHQTAVAALGLALPLVADPQRYADLASVADTVRPEVSYAEEVTREGDCYFFTVRLEAVLEA